MADSFFGFETTMPALGAGKHDNELRVAPEDEKIDLMNDETFGDSAEVHEDWEKHHEIFAEELEAGNGLNNGHCSSLDSAERFRFPEEDLEQSLSQLVVDDEDELDDPAIMNVSKNRPIPQQRKDVNLDELFGPSSPPAFLDTEHLVSPGRANIWGSPLRDQFVPSQEEGVKNLLQMLKQPPPGQKKTAFQDPSIIGAKTLSSSLPNAYNLEDVEQDMIHQQQRRSSRPITAEELEREMRGEVPAGRQIPGRGRSPPPQGFPLPIGTPPRGQYMQQIPQRHHSGPMAAGVRAGMSPVNSFGHQGTPAGLHKGSPPGVPHSNHQSNGLTPAQLSLLLSASSPSPPPLIPARVGSPSPLLPARIVTPPPVPASTPLSARRITSPTPTCISPTLLQSTLASVIQAGLISNVLASQMSGSPVGKVLHANTPPGPMPPFLANTPVHQRVSYPGGSSDPTHGRVYRGGSHMNNPRQQLYSRDRSKTGPGSYQHQHRDGRYDTHRGRGRGRGDRGGFRGDYHHGGRHWQHNYFHQQYEEEEDKKPIDSYDNLMTQKEKDWIIKIQLMQLHTDNPYLDDYYYTTWMMKKLARERQKKKQEGVQSENQDTQEPVLLLPQLASVEGRSYKPVQFEGSLGRLTASSVHNPRQILDVKSNTLHEGEDNKHKEIRKFKQLLLDVEQSYDLLLDIDDVEKRAFALPEEARPSLFLERRQKIEQLLGRILDHVDGEEHFIQVANMRKGIKLMARTLKLLDRGQSTILVCAILRYLSVFMKKKDLQTEVLPMLSEAMSHTLNTANLEMLALFAEQLYRPDSQNQANTLVTSLQNKFGSYVVWSMINRGQTIYSTTSPVDMEVEHQNSWGKFVQAVAQAMEAVDRDKLCPPGVPLNKVSSHLEEQLSTKAFVAVEDKLSSLASSEVARES